jgi:hypothetical protein
MASEPSDWPEGLSDDEAVERLETLMLMACEGNKDLSNGREYKALRRELLARADLADVVPKYIRTQRDLAAFWAYIKAHSPQWEPRRQHIRETFGPLRDRVEGLTRPPVRASKWTGRRTASEQARVVIALGYDALAGIDALLYEQERGLHNGGPVEPEREDAIKRLKELHNELGELLRLAEAEEPLNDKLARVRALKDSLLRWTASPAGFALGSLPLSGSALVIAVGVSYIVNAISPGLGVTAGLAAGGMHIAAAGVQVAREGRGKSD